MIKGIGVDIALMNRFESFLNDEKKLKKILSINEYQELLKITSKSRQLEFIAGRFASKEAFIKATNSYKLKFTYSDITIANDESGAPILTTSFIFPDNIHLSISHDGEYVISYIVIETKENVYRLL